MKKLKGLRSRNVYLQNSHGDVKYSIGNVVNSIVIMMYDVRWLLNLLGESPHELYI